MVGPLSLQLFSSSCSCSCSHRPLQPPSSSSLFLCRIHIHVHMYSDKRILFFFSHSQFIHPFRIPLTNTLSHQSAFIFSFSRCLLLHPFSFSFLSLVSLSSPFLSSPPLLLSSLLLTVNAPFSTSIVLDRPTHLSNNTRTSLYLDPNPIPSNPSSVVLL